MSGAVKGILLGSTAVIAAVATAQAADLPSRKAEPASYVKICDAYGSGFFFIPGTDTCLAINLLARAEYGAVTQSSLLTIPSFKLGATAAATTTTANTTLVPSGAQDATGWMSRAIIGLDARTQSSLGTVRTVIAVRSQFGSGVENPADNYATGALTGQSGTTTVTVEQALVQFAGFTFGRTTRDPFSFMPPDMIGSFHKSSYVPGLNVLAYQATFGGGFSAIAALVDRSSQPYSTTPGYIGVGPGGTYFGSTVFATSANQVAGAVTNGPFTLPAVQANVRYDGSWGSLQLMGDVQQNVAATNLVTGAAGSPNFTLTKTGFAVGAGLKINLPMLAAGDTLYASVAYADGDLTQLASSNTSAITSGFGRETGGFMRFDCDFYVTPASAASIAAAGGCAPAAFSRNCLRGESTTGWSTIAYFKHFWTPTIEQWFGFSYMSLTPGTQTRNTDWLLGGLSSTQVWRGGTMIRWTPAKNLSIMGEVDYVRLNQKLAATSVANGGTGIASCLPGNVIAGCAAIPASLLKAGGQAWEGRLRAERRF